MGVIKAAVAEALEPLVEGTLGAITKIQENHLGKKELQLELRKLAEQSAARADAYAMQEMVSRESVVRAELGQDDKFTKRMRPTIGYVGLAMIVIVHALLPALSVIAQRPMPTFSLPPEFWLAWGGYVSTYAIGRSFGEKRARIIAES